MTKQLNSLVSTALTAAHAYGTAVADIKAALKGHTSPEDVRAALLVPVALYYSVPVLHKVRGEGTALCEYTNKARTERRTKDDADAVYVKGYEAAKKSLQRLCADVLGKKENQAPELDVPAHIAKLAAALVQAAAEYEGAGKLIATALAQAKAK